MCFLSFPTVYSQLVPNRGERTSWAHTMSVNEGAQQTNKIQIEKYSDLRNYSTSLDCWEFYAISSQFWIQNSNLEHLIPQLFIWTFGWCFIQGHCSSCCCCCCHPHFPFSKSTATSCLARAETLNGPKVFSFETLPRAKQLGRKKEYFSRHGQDCVNASEMCNFLTKLPQGRQTWKGILQMDFLLSSFATRINRLDVN